MSRQPRPAASSSARIRARPSSSAGGPGRSSGSANPETDVLFYRRDAFAAAGLDPDSPPRTLDDLERDAQALKDAGASTPPIALAASSSLVENWLTGVGIDIVDHNNGHEKPASKANPRCAPRRAHG